MKLKWIDATSETEVANLPNGILVLTTVYSDGDGDADYGKRISVAQTFVPGLRVDDDGDVHFSRGPKVDPIPQPPPDRRP